MSYGKGLLVLFGCFLAALVLSGAMHKVLAMGGDVSAWIAIGAVIAVLVWPRRKTPRKPPPWMKSP